MISTGSKAKGLLFINHATKTIQHLLPVKKVVAKVINGQ